MGEKELIVISRILNNSEFKVLAWSKTPHQTEVSGLKDCEFIGQLPMQNQGKNKFEMYIYVKLPPNIRKKGSLEEEKVPVGEDESSNVNLRNKKANEKNERAL